MWCGGVRSKERPSSLVLPPFSSPRGPINRPSPGCGSVLRGGEHQAAVSSQAPCQHGQLSSSKKLFWRAVVAAGSSWP